MQSLSTYSMVSLHAYSPWTSSPACLIEGPDCQFMCQTYRGTRISEGEKVVMVGGRWGGGGGERGEGEGDEKGVWKVGGRVTGPDRKESGRERGLSASMSVQYVPLFLLLVERETHFQYLSCILDMPQLRFRDGRQLIKSLFSPPPPPPPPPPPFHPSLPLSLLPPSFLSFLAEEKWRPVEREETNKEE